MSKKIKHKMLTVCASALTLVAMATAVSACLWFFYQPEEPKLIRDSYDH